MSHPSVFSRKSPWILHFDTGSCNGCDLEIWALLTRRYDVERFGMVNKANPKHADILLITGPVTKKCEDRLRIPYNQTPEPKLAVACGGDCASTRAHSRTAATWPKASIMSSLLMCSCPGRVPPRGDHRRRRARHREVEEEGGGDAPGEAARAGTEP